MIFFNWLFVSVFILSILEITIWNNELGIFLSLETWRILRECEAGKKSYTRQRNAVHITVAYGAYVLFINFSEGQKMISRRRL